MTSTDHSSLDGPVSEEAALFWRRLLHRWFVEYNPLYLLSATLVLGGCFLWSRGLVDRQGLSGPLGVSLVAESYGAALLLGAALLMRIRLPRPAVLLALLAILYQWDMTLHTETCAYLGATGAWATAVWFAIFVGKLRLFGWALHVRIARRVVITALLAAGGLALGPRLLPSLGGRGASGLLAVWLFALATLYRPGGVTSMAELGPWAQTVLRRVTRAAWLLSAGLVGAHVFLWWRDHNLSLGPALLAVPLLVMREVRSELRMWATVVATLSFAAIAQPTAFFVTSFIAAAALAVRAFSLLVVSAVSAPETAGREQPYRGSHETQAWVSAIPVVAPAQRARLVAGALFATYMGAWTTRWSSGPWPAHVLFLDAVLALVTVALVWRTRRRTALLPLGATCAHFVVQSRVLPIPHSIVAWGEAAVALGFVLLGGSLLTAWRIGPSSEPGWTPFESPPRPQPEP